MTNYIALGCSLTAQEGWVAKLSSSKNLSIRNLAVSAGSNELQIARLRNLIFQNEINNEIVLIWQITGWQREFQVLRPSQDNKKYMNGEPGKGSFDYWNLDNSLDDSDTIALLAGNAYFKSFPLKHTQYAIQHLTSEIWLWSRLVKHIFICTGWAGICNEKGYTKMSTFLNKQSNISLLPAEYSIFDWCKSKNLPLSDDTHPSKESYEQWAESVLWPWISRIDSQD